MKVKPKNYTYSDIIEYIDNPYTQSLDPLGYGKSVQNAVEDYITYNVNLIAGKEILVDVAKDPKLTEQYKYSNNGPGFDRILLPNYLKIQKKFRQVDGKTPYSNQVHFENTRRHSDKNRNESAVSGHVRYSVSEFDYVIVVLCHIVNEERPDYKDWSYSLVPTSELEDVNYKGYCLPNIPSSVLLKNKCENIYLLTSKLLSL